MMKPPDHLLDLFVNSRERPGEPEVGVSVAVGNPTDQPGQPRYFTAADWNFDEPDENGISELGAALIASLEAEKRKRGWWNRFKAIWKRT